MTTLEIQKVDLASFCYLNKERYPFLLESVNHNENNRYSILFAFPEENIVLRDFADFDFLNKLENQCNQTSDNTSLPFNGGWFVYLSYELIGQIEPTLASKIHKSNIPIAYAVKIPSAIITDHKLKKTYVFDEDNDQTRINQILSDIKAIENIPDAPLDGEISEENNEKFTDGVKRSLDYIVAGDVFQVNLSRKWSYSLSSKEDSAIIYKQLKKANPAPFSALVQYEDFSIISSSPERLFSVNDGVLETRPIAGTHPRGEGRSDAVQKENLISHPKEIAEHVMLLDLERNDMGRVCEYGSVYVNEIMTLETYPYVHHIVSNIKGNLRKHIGVKQIVKALFPGGTITGCPKVRCIEIINELEQMPREAYTGSVGYVSQNGKMDFNILIRSFIHKGDTLTFRAGAGIVFDSDPLRELAETRHKAQGLIKVFEK
ncbi:aminodeoxychorismate synthase component I [Candidatus Pseudothioglobus singularis]|nr:aminodeoxychorismate synthase component I [Candidatus Pseudothioglobus singularis]MDB4598880.1 aminodeoxychorismate synthase component I [Candidatus Pseudothioglobus singularis]MDC1065003.1 aminodeoxychorismate synthase component I [Candidatus Pseudothioglobus singularis]